MEKVQLVPGISTNPLERLRAEMDTLPTASRKAAQVFLDNAEWAVRASVDELALRADVSAPTIVRLCRTLGFSGLTDLAVVLVIFGALAYLVYRLARKIFVESA